jgi:hypothetical protein
MPDEEEKKPKKEFTITEEDKVDFFKCFLADKPYEETVYLFGSKFKVKFRTLTTKQTKDVFNQLRQSQLNDELTNDANYMVTSTAFRLALSLVELNGDPFNPDISEEDYAPASKSDSYVRAKSAIFETWPIFKLSAILDAFKAFEHKVVELTDAVQTENFWKAA